MDRPTDKQIADVLAGLASAEEAKRLRQKKRRGWRNGLPRMRARHTCLKRSTWI